MTRTLKWRLAAVVVACLMLSCAAEEAGNDASGTGGGGGGVAGNGGSSGGSTGVAGQSGSSGASGIAGASGVSGGGGSAGSAGAAGVAGGAAGNAGRGGAAGGSGSGAGASGNAGSAGNGGRGGAAGAAGASGRGGAAGGGGAAGAGGRGGAGGASGSGGQTNLPAGVTALFPPPNAQGVCADPPLRITFSGAPSVGTSGRIQVFNSGGTAVSTVDVAAASYTTTNGGMAFTTQRPVYVDGNDVVIQLPSKPLGFGQTYYVTVESGAIRAPGGAALAITGTTAWRFSTAAAAPSNRAALSVALDGSAAFCSVQGALDIVPANNTAAVAITIAPGTYHEIIYFRAKSNVTLQGQDRARTIIAATNNNNLNPSTRGRALVGVDAVSGLVVRNLTIHNLTPQGGSQAEALRLQDCDRCVVRDATILSLQDTLLWSGRIYAANCLIAGNVDFVWGDGAVLFQGCEIKTVGRSGPIVQARNPASDYGYVFVDCKLTSDAGLTGSVLARIDVGGYPASHVAYINCQMSSNITAAGWQITAGTNTSMLRFWEYKSVDPSGNPINVGSRLAGSRQLTDAQAAMMRDPAVVLGGWVPPAN